MPVAEKSKVTRKQLIDGLNDDLAREYQAIISYVNYSQVLKGAAYTNIADELAVHAKEELTHALKIANHVDYLGGMPSVTPKSVKTSDKAEDMLKFDLAIGFYIGKQGLESTYGAAASIIVVLIWVYYSSQIILMGAEVTRAFAQRNGSRRVSA